VTPQNMPALTAYAADYKRIEERGDLLPPLLPVDVQLREDAALGAALRRVIALAPSAMHHLEITPCGPRSDHWHAFLIDVKGSPIEHGSGGPPEAALRFLAERLEALNAAG
jgi:hypothetical protein